MVVVRALSLSLVLASCGRFSFDPLSGDAGVGDARVDATPDARDSAMLDPSLELLIDFEGTIGDVAKGRGVTCVGGCPTPEAGIRGLVGSFSGSQCLQVPNAPVFETQTFSVALWFRATDTGVETMFSKPLMGMTTFQNSFELYKTQVGNVFFTTAGTNSTAAGQFTDTVWHHVAATYANSQVRTFLDGALQGAQTITTTYGGDALMIGCDLDMNTVIGEFVGQLDDVRYYSRALSDLEIAALAQ